MKKKVIEWIEKWFHQFLVKKIFGSAIGGVKGIVITYLFGLLWKKYVKPNVLLVWRKTEMLFRKHSNKKKVKETVNAENKDDLDDAFSKLP